MPAPPAPTSPDAPMSLIELDLRQPLYSTLGAAERPDKERWGPLGRANRVVEGPPIGRGVPFRETEIFRSFQQVFTEGRDWAETAFYRDAAAKIRAGDVLWNCATPQALLARLENDIRALFESMRAHGFLRQTEISRALAAGGAGAEGLQRFASDEYPASIKAQNEIKLGVNERGEFLFLDGRHRLSIALVLGLPSAPARVVFRHRLWHDFRAGVQQAVAGRPGMKGRFVTAHADLPRAALTKARVQRLQARYDEMLKTLPGGAGAGGMTLFQHAPAAAQAVIAERRLSLARARRKARKKARREGRPAAG